jgi:hypothetical protein
LGTWAIILWGGAAAGALVLLHAFAVIKRDSSLMLDTYRDMLAASRRLKAEEDAEDGAPADDEDAAD